MDPFAEYIHQDTPWDDALAELLGASNGNGFPSLNDDSFPSLPPFQDTTDAGFTPDQLAAFTSLAEFSHLDGGGGGSVTSPASVGSGGTTTEGELSVLHSSPGGSSRGVQIKGEGSTEGEVSWGVVGEGWGVAPGLLGELHRRR